MNTMFTNLSDLFVMVSCFDFPCVPSSFHFVRDASPPDVQMILKPGSKAAFKWFGSTVQVTDLLFSRLACFVLKFSLFQCSLTMHGNRAVTVIGMMLIVDGVMAMWTLVVWREKASTVLQAPTPCRAKPPKSEFAQSLSDVSRLSSDNFMKASFTHLDII